MERYGESDLDFVFCERTFCVTAEFGYFCLDAIHFTVEAVSLAAVLLGT